MFYILYLPELERILFWGVPVEILIRYKSKYVMLFQFSILISFKLQCILFYVNVS